ncbi:MAG: type II toxin-antitoxin system VapC family toxin [Gemmataceae bacterium]|nr:type II toxin-antitoxin system VapC family toxin [Gemmataceae bacterium]
MKYVIDTSVAFKWVVPEPDSAKALLLLDDFRNAIHDLHGPSVFSIELAHALTRAERQGRVPMGQAAVLWGDVMVLPPRFHDDAPLIPRAIGMSSQLRIGVYDCLYLALAEREKCEFITADNKLVNNVQQHFAFVRHVSTLP